MNDLRDFAPNCGDAFGARGWSPSSSLSNNPIMLSSLLGITNRHSHYAQGLAPTRYLNDKIRSREWDAARIRVLSHPSDVFYKAKERNNATSLHLACLYRAPKDLVEMILDFNPNSLLCQDSEGWTPIHVVLLYGNDEETAITLIRRGGKEAVSIQSPIVGSPLHLAFRHGCSANIIQELLNVHPGMATTANEYSTKPATILWHQYSRNPDNERFLRELRNTAANPKSRLRNKEQEENVRGLVHRLELLLRAANGNKNHTNHNNNKNSVVIHDVVVSADDATSRLGNLIEYLPLVLVLYPEQVRSTDELGNFPLHKAASNRPCNSSTRGHLNRASSMPTFASSSTTTTHPTTSSSSGDPVEILLQTFPTAAGIPNRLGLMPLHIALSQGRRTWRTGIACMVLAAPQALMMRCAETKLLPFQLAATMSYHESSSGGGDTSQGNNNHGQQQEDNNSIEIIETILQLLLACPHAIMCDQ